MTNFQSSVAFHVETSHLFCRAQHVSVFYMKPNTRLKRGIPNSILLSFII